MLEGIASQDSAPLGFRQGYECGGVRIMTSAAISALPIGIRLFNRPECAEPLLKSLASQSLDVTGRRISCTIDGYQGSLDQLRGKPDRTDEVANVVKKYFPDAHIHRYEKNVGLAVCAFDLAHDVFDNTDKEWAIFLEEDIVLKPDFVKAIEHLVNLADDHSEVVKVATHQVRLAYAQIPAAPTRKNFYLGQGTRAIAERKSFFESRLPLTEKYLEIISGSQYSDRDESDVFSRLAQFGIFTLMGNNDEVQDRITIYLGGLHITTPQSFVLDESVGGETSFRYPDIALPDSQSAEILATTQEDFAEALPSIKKELSAFEYRFFKQFWGGYMTSKSGSLALRVLIRKLLRKG